MKKREFIKTTTVLSIGAAMSPLAACNNTSSKEAASGGAAISAAQKEFTLPDLPYGFDALQPAIDARTMEIHHGKHHAGYVRKLNKALTSHPQESNDLMKLLQKASGDADYTGIRNNGGGHYNHSLFWQILSPKGGQEPTGQLKDALMSSFGSMDNFKEEFGKAAATRFGSGWAWLSIDDQKKLFISSTPNQDNPLMSKLVERSGIPILGLDVWEHAYYLQYQNKRKEYISNFFKIVNWEGVAAQFAKMM